MTSKPTPGIAYTTERSHGPSSTSGWEWLRAVRSRSIGSAPLPLRPPLLDEGRHSFPLVLAGEQGEERPALVTKPGRQRQLLRELDGFLGREHGHRRLARDGPGQLEGRRQR